MFKDEQYRLNQTAGGEPRPVGVWMILTVVINRYCSSLNRPPRLRCAKAPRLTQAGNGSINAVAQCEPIRHRIYQHHLFGILLFYVLANQQEDVPDVWIIPVFFTWPL